MMQAFKIIIDRIQDLASYGDDLKSSNAVDEGILKPGKLRLTEEMFFRIWFPENTVQYFVGTTEIAVIGKKQIHICIGDHGIDPFPIFSIRRIAPIVHEYLARLIFQNIRTI